jgi:hypothetical protein
MDKNLKERLLNEAIRIAEDIYDKRKEDKNGIYWETLFINHENNRKVEWKASEGIYTGVSGISLFFLNLYKVTGNKKYLKICKDSLRWVIKHSKRSKYSNYSFIVGKMGIAYVLIKLAEVCKGNYLKEALKIAKGCDTFFSFERLPCEYMHGASGILLALLHLYDATNEKWLLDKIDIYIKFIIDKAYYNHDGLHWDRSLNCIKSLCGFSHGMTGIAFVFLELGKYYNNSAFYYIAEQLFSYESNFYSKKVKNWLDLRSSIFDEKTEMEHKTAFMERRYNFFTEEKFPNAWCHGAPGIGLSRLRAYELLKKNIYRKEIEICVNKVMISKSFRKDPSFNICHGLGGNLDLLIDVVKSLKDKRIRRFLDITAGEMLKFHSINNIYLSGIYTIVGDIEDYSMFIGNAGIGYFYLRLIEPDKIESILAPKLLKKSKTKIKGRKYSNINISIRSIKEKILKIGYKRTLQLFWLSYHKKLEEYLNKPIINKRENEVKEFQKFVKACLKLNGNNNELIKDIFELETKKIEVDSKIKSYSLINARTLFQKELINNIMSNDELLLKSRIIMNMDICLYKTKWDWTNTSNEKSINIKKIIKKPKLLLLAGSIDGTIENEISAFCYNILIHFKNGSQVNDVIIQVLNLFESDSKAYSDKIKVKTIEQIRSMLKDRILDLE